MYASTLIRLSTSTSLNLCAFRAPYVCTVLRFISYTPLRLYVSTPLLLYGFTPLRIKASTPLRLYAYMPLCLFRLYACKILVLYSAVSYWGGYNRHKREAENRAWSQGWNAHFRDIQREADFNPDISIARLPNQTQDKLKG